MFTEGKMKLEFDKAKLSTIENKLEDMSAKYDVDIKLTDLYETTTTYVLELELKGKQLNKFIQEFDSI
jgi:hypothetical protein